MKICFPTTDARGLDAPLSDHFGRAPSFTFVEPATGHVEVESLVHVEHAHGHCNRAATVAAANAGVVVCRGLGRGALERLSGMGVQVLATGEATVRDALAAWSAGRLQPLGAESTCVSGGGCGHHDHDHDHGHAHDHEHH